MRKPLRVRALTPVQEHVLDNIEAVVPHQAARAVKLQEYVLDDVYCAEQINALLRDHLIVRVDDGPPYFRRTAKPKPAPGQKKARVERPTSSSTGALSKDGAMGSGADTV